MALKPIIEQRKVLRAFISEITPYAGAAIHGIDPVRYKIASFSDKSAEVTPEMVKAAVEHFQNLGWAVQQADDELLFSNRNLAGPFSDPDAEIMSATSVSLNERLKTHNFAEGTFVFPLENRIAPKLMEELLFFYRQTAGWDVSHSSDKKGTNFVFYGPAPGFTIGTYLVCSYCDKIRIKESRLGYTSECSLGGIALVHSDDEVKQLKAKNQDAVNEYAGCDKFKSSGLPAHPQNLEKMIIHNPVCLSIPADHRALEDSYDFLRKEMDNLRNMS